jgi:hypothetical protein
VLIRGLAGFRFGGKRLEKNALRWDAVCGRRLTL